MFNTFRENRRLVKDLRTADAVHMQQLDEISDLKNELTKSENRCTDIGREKVKVKSELTKIKKLVRKQTGADLLVNALIELGVVPKPTPEHDSFARQADLQNQMAQAQQHDHYRGLSGNTGLTGLLGGIG